MSNEINAIQESIKIALDAADAASDVTSEYNRVKKQHKKLESSVKSVHRYTILIFSSSMLAAIAALVFASMLYFRTMSELTTMTTTSREALVVFAENVDEMNGTLEKLKTSLDTQQQLLAVNERLIEQLDGLQTSILSSNAQLVSSLEQSAKSSLDSNSAMMSKMTKAVSRDIALQAKLISDEIALSREDNAKSMDRMSANLKSDRSMSKLAESQNQISGAISQLNEQNALLLKKFDDKENSISFP